MSASVRPALAFIHVTVIDVRSGRLRPGQTVIVMGRRIQALGVSGRVRVPADAQVVDAYGKYLIPGLWDMHVHQGRTCRWSVSHPMFIANGVTGVREAFTPQLDSMLRLRREIAAGTRVGPRQLIAGPALVAGSRPDLGIDCADPQHRVQLQAVLRTPADARRVVDSLQAAGADFIKTRMSGYAEPPTFDSLSPEQALAAERAIYFAAAAEARRVGIRFEGHLPWGVVTQLTAADSGQRLIDHDVALGYCSQGAAEQLMSDSERTRFTRVVGDTANAAACRRLASHLRRRHSWLVPGPLSLFCAQPLSDSAQWGRPAACLDSNWTARIPRNSWRMAAAAGVPMLAGTDIARVDPANGLGYGTTVHATLAALVWLGLSPLQALQAATLNPALAYHMTDSLGTIERGKVADMVLLDANPLVDIFNTTTIRAVVANGRYFDRAALDQLLVEVKESVSKAAR